MAAGDTEAAPAQRAGSGPVLFAFDGSELAACAIEEAGSQLSHGREALVVCVWQPVDVGFVLPEGRHLNAAEATEVRRAAEDTAARGAGLAEAAGFRARSAAIEAAPTWKGIVAAAEEHDAALIVFGSHCRSGLSGRLQGSVSGDVMKHCAFSVLVVRGQA
jgi:nucleotide-binding universal stress UspA family protein